MDNNNVTLTATQAKLLGRFIRSVQNNDAAISNFVDEAGLDAAASRDFTAAVNAVAGDNFFINDSDD